MALVPFSLFFRSQGFEYTSLFTAIGLVGISIYLIAKIRKGLSQRFTRPYLLFLELSLLLMTVTIYSRYLYFTFWDYPGIISVPFFLASFALYIQKEINKNDKVISLSIVFLILTIPLIGVNDFYKSPRQLIPVNWYNPFDVEKARPLSLPWEFVTSEAYECSLKSYNLKLSKNFEGAIYSYKRCLEVEQNPRFYFELSQCYLEIGKLQAGIRMLDSVIQLDPSFSVTYNNRGLIYYKLKENVKAIQDYKIAIELDSTQSFYYSNLGLAYYYEDQFEDACSNLRKAKEMGLELSDFGARILRLKCK